jgi:hypothetical protein
LSTVTGLDSLPWFPSNPRSLTNTMGKQYNKVIKKKRRIAYLKRKNVASKAKAKKK